MELDYQVFVPVFYLSIDFYGIISYTTKVLAGGRAVN